jgi:hypothetical protein
MIEKTCLFTGLQRASLPGLKIAMKIPFLIFLVSGLAALQLEPIATRGSEWLQEYAKQQMYAHHTAGKVLRAGDNRIVCLREQLADVQLDLMKVLETDHAATARLETREAGLKYALRAEQVRRDEMAQCRKAAQQKTNPLLSVARCFLPSDETPQS